MLDCIISFLAVASFYFFVYGVWLGLFIICGWLSDKGY